jgi:hypothetical protein
VARSAEPLLVASFDSSDDPLSRLRASPQGQYLRWYLADLEAKSVLVEPSYFDRDYLSEFAAFYCTSAAGYPNVCCRVHYFSASITRETLARAVEREGPERALMTESYLGFMVIRRALQCGSSVLSPRPRPSARGESPPTAALRKRAP